MVFEEAASHKPRSWHTWNQRSALTPKVPAPLDVSPPNAQTHRPPNQSLQFVEDKMHSVYFAFSKLHQVSSYLSHVRKNLSNIA